MPLPFLKPKHQVGVIVSHRKPDGSNEASHMEGEENQGLEVAMGDLIRAIHSKDEKSAAIAFKNAFELCESEPHEEGPHTNDEEQE